MHFTPILQLKHEHSDYMEAHAKQRSNPFKSNANWFNQTAQFPQYAYSSHRSWTMEPVAAIHSIT